MPNTLTERQGQLRDWLLRLVDLLLDRGGSLAAALERTVVDRTAVVCIDEVALKLEARRMDGRLAVHIDPAANTEPFTFRCTGDALRDVIHGRSLLDAAVASGAIEVRASLPDLLAMHDLVLRTLACGPLSRPLRELWAEFDARWPSAIPDCRPLRDQLPRYGALLKSVPEDVLRVRLDDSPD